MAYIPPRGGGGGITPTPTPTPTPTSNTINTSNTGTTSLPESAAEWHKALLWFLGAVALIAIASPAPSIATWLVVILIFWVLLKNWSDYAMFLGLAK